MTVGKVLIRGAGLGHHPTASAEQADSARQCTHLGTEQLLDLGHEVPKFADLKRAIDDPARLFLPVGVGVPRRDELVLEIGT